MQRYAQLLCLLMLGLLNACSSASQSTALDLTKGEWVVEDIAGGGIVDSSRITLNFAPDGRLSGRAGCNQYSTKYSLSSKLNIGNIAMTKMACAPALLDQEYRFTQLLAAATSATLDTQGALILHSSDGKTITARQQ